MLSAGMKQPFSSADERKVKPCTDDARRIPSALENCTSDLYRQSRFRMNRCNAPHITRSRRTMHPNCDFQGFDGTRGFDRPIGIAARQHHLNFFLDTAALSRRYCVILGSTPAL